MEGAVGGANTDITQTIYKVATVGKTEWSVVYPCSTSAKGVHKTFMPLSVVAWREDTATTTLWTTQ